MKRIAHAALAVLLLTLLAAVASSARARKPNAESILARAAGTARSAKSLHLTFAFPAGAARVVARIVGAEGDAVSEDDVTMPATAECWWSRRALYLSAFRRDGTLMDASGINVDTGRWWEYDAEQGTLYVADFKRFASNLVRVLAKATPVAFSALHRSLFGMAPPDAKKSVTFKTRHGRRIAVITATFKAKGSPLHQEGKDVVEVDTETNHLLSSLTYIRLGDEPWQLFFIGMDDIEWDVPVPRHLAAPKIPQGTKAVHVAAAVAETDDVLTLEIRDQALTEKHQRISMHFKKK